MIIKDKEIKKDPTTEKKQQKGTKYS